MVRFSKDKQNKLKETINTHLSPLPPLCVRHSLTGYPWMAWNWLCSSGWSETHRNQPASASRMPEVKACATTPDRNMNLWVEGNVIQIMLIHSSLLT